ncbi:serine/threonine-protein kinase 33 isoform X2 [Aphelocoma coerulescens]|uniref:serine/threonine-protein kinase 33 isoform X2 n=1 Tax=Aphelocoma coerulescens TaxID=39617 RepID=UPI003604746F
MHVTVLAVFSFVLHCLIIWEENENSFNGIEGLFTSVGLKFLARYTDNFDLNLSVEGHRDNSVGLLCAGYQWNKQRMDPYEPGQLNPDTMKITCDLEVCDKRIQHGRGGIVRRDLKLENILVKSSDINEVNEVKLNVKVSSCRTELLDQEFTVWKRRLQAEKNFRH